MKLLGSRTEPIRYSVADAAIAEFHEQFMGLTVQGLSDKEGLARVHEARMVMKRHRVDVEKKRKALKADALEYGRQVDAEAKRLTALMAPIEEHLAVEEDRIKEAKRAAKEAADAARKALLDQRMAALAAVKSPAPPSAVEAMTDEEFGSVLEAATAAFQEAEAERKRLEAEQAEARRLEAERVAAERVELERLRAEQEAAHARVAEERAALEMERAEIRMAQEKREAEARAQAEAVADPEPHPLNKALDAIEALPEPPAAAPKTRSGMFMVTDVRCAADDAFERLSAYSIEDRAAALRMLAEKLLDEAKRLEQQGATA